MNAKFEEWLDESVNVHLENEWIAPGQAKETIRAFVREVNARAEAKMLQTGKLEGAHHAAIEQLLKEWGIDA